MIPFPVKAVKLSADARQQEGQLWTDSLMPPPHSGFFPGVLGVIPKGKVGEREGERRGGAHQL